MPTWGKQKELGKTNPSVKIVFCRRETALGKAEYADMRETCSTRQNVTVGENSFCPRETALGKTAYADIRKWATLGTN